MILIVSPFFFDEILLQKLFPKFLIRQKSKLHVTPFIKKSLSKVENFSPVQSNVDTTGFVLNAGLLGNSLFYFRGPLFTNSHSRMSPNRFDNFFRTGGGFLLFLEETAPLEFPLIFVCFPQPCLLHY